jgi:L-lysine 2,3-aminomutase
MMVEKETVMVAAIYDTSCDVFCQHCGRQFVLMFNESDMYDWVNGYFAIQDALHYLSMNERELLLSGTCGDCFDKMFPPSLDNDD